MFSVGTAPGRWQIFAQRTDDEARKPITNGGPMVTYTRAGYLVFSSGEVVMAARFDADRLELTGNAVPVMQSVDVANFAVSETGMVLTREGWFSVSTATPTGANQLMWVDRTGAVAPIFPEENVFRRPRLSPDGRRIAVEIFEGESTDVWVYEIARGTRIRLTTTEALEQDPIWTPDGTTVVFASSSDGSSDLHQKAADGSGEPTPFPAIESNNEAHSFSPDGKVLAYYQRAAGSDQNRDIWTMSMEGDYERKPFLVTPFNERSPAFSPDGRWIAYVSDESGIDEIYVLPYPGPGQRTVVSRGGGREPVWARDGTELFYRNGNAIWAASVGLGETFQAETPQRLFEGRFLAERAASGSQTYDVAPDGRFILVQPTEQSSQLHVTMNWFQELQERVPTRR